MDKKTIAILTSAAAVCAYGITHFAGLFDNNLNLVAPIEDVIAAIPELLGSAGGFAVIAACCDEYFAEKRKAKKQEASVFSDISMS